MPILSWCAHASTLVPSSKRVLRPQEKRWTTRGGAARPRASRRSAAEDAIEVGEIAEAHVLRHRADGAVGKTRIAQHPMRARKTLAEQEFRISDAFAPRTAWHGPWRKASTNTSSSARGWIFRLLTAGLGARPQDRRDRPHRQPTLQTRFARVAVHRACTERQLSARRFRYGVADRALARRVSR